MYYPAPGHQHIKVLVPRATFPDVERLPGVRAVPDNPMAPLVRQALDASFGVRDPESLTGALFDMGVRSHIRARLRQPRPAGEVRVLSCHTRENGEAFGSVAVGERRYAWAAKMRNGRLVSFKVL
ncbi:hypothetical protein M5J20_07130 [Corynebacterium sp. TA-R-1]|uniref:Uncharacterized protein n=1 Tax=Corynebacterium stercoris TaxID=2943490 RepID=A0ABT1G5H4_9CORY|nr:hypothetical protein [Corynebacterium stercoris]MCP1387962.1 hypothetical protein [Corynebacterium stercoris]